MKHLLNNNKAPTINDADLVNFKGQKLHLLLLLATMIVLILIVACTDEDNITPNSIEKRTIQHYTNEKEVDIPTLYIDTDGSASITSKTEYVRARMRIICSEEQASWRIDTTTLYIRGRGNSTWDAPKKPFRIKLDQKKNLLGMKASKEWVLLANWFDRSLLHTSIAFWIGQHSSLAWTPHGEFCEKYLNGEYIGNYYLCEKIEIATSRLNIPNDSYLLEVTQPRLLNNDEVSFASPFNTFSVKEPKVKKGDASYEWIKDYITEFDNNIHSNDITNSDVGYARKIDMLSFADWYLVNEIVKNSDAVFYSSCYMYVTPDGLLHMGPIWDFDLSLGSSSNPDVMGRYEGLWVNKGDWMSVMCQDEAFSALVRERFDYFKLLIPQLMNYIDEQANYIPTSAAHNDERWNALLREDAWLPIYGTFEAEVQAVKDFLNARMEYLDKNLNGCDNTTGISFIMF